MNSKIVRKTIATAKSSKAVAPASKSATVAKPGAEPVATTSKLKNKLVRDSFTIPKAEYALLEGLKVRAANLARPVKKSELLRAGISALNGMGDKAFLAAVNAVPSLKTGRPSGSQAVAPAAKGAK